MKLINKILYISAILVIILIIVYIAFSFTNISTNIKQDYFVNTHFKATNNTEYIKFGDFTNTTLCYQGRIYDMEQVTYQDGIFKMIDKINKKLKKKLNSTLLLVNWTKVSYTNSIRLNFDSSS